MTQFGQRVHQVSRTLSLDKQKLARVASCRVYAAERAGYQRAAGMARPDLCVAPCQFRTAGLDGQPRCSYRPEHIGLCHFCRQTGVGGQSAECGCHRKSFYAADAWSEGNFSVVPQDRSNDEISALGIRLRNMAERIQTLLRTQQELAMLEERNRIARELHDTIKQQNFATLMQIRAARNQFSSYPAAAAQALTEAEHLIKTSQQELGIIITELRPTALEQKGLARALQLYLETWSHQSNIQATLRAQNEKPLAPELELSLYRVAQEALANIARHSHATAVNVALTYAPNEMNMIFTDNGVGFDVNQAQGFGLASMQERITALGGTLKVLSANGNGTTLAARVPLGEQDGGTH